MKISKRAFDMIVEFEVSSKAVYEAKYRKPEWPGVKSGVTIGIGYDVGYHTVAELRGDWLGKIPAKMVYSLEVACGVTGASARSLAESLGSVVDVPWQAALEVYSETDVPKWEAIVARALPNTDRLHPDCLGALVSLAFNRGASFKTDGPRYEEMRNIRAHILAGRLDKIPAEIRAMKRLWPGVNGLLRRRDAEAALFERGLNPPKAPGVGTGTTVAATTAVVVNEASKQGASGETVALIAAIGIAIAVAAFFIVRHFRR